MSFYYSTHKTRKMCSNCELWKTTAEHFKKTNPVQDGFNANCVLCESKEPRKICSNCEQMIGLSKYSKRKASADGYQHSCKSCVKDLKEDIKRKKHRK